MSGFVHPEFLVETDWLEQNLANPKVVVLDCTVHLRTQPNGPYRIEPARADFGKGHVAGAQFCDVQRDVSDTTQKFTFMRPTAEGFAAAMRRCALTVEAGAATTLHVALAPDAGEVTGAYYANAARKGTSAAAADAAAAARLWEESVRFIETYRAGGFGGGAGGGGVGTDGAAAAADKAKRA